MARLGRIEAVQTMSLGLLLCSRRRQLKLGADCVKYKNRGKVELQRPT